MSAIIFIVETLLSLALSLVLAPRLCCSGRAPTSAIPLVRRWCGYESAHPAAVRRALPPIASSHTASVVAVLVIATRRA